jgi:hypothetical protein
MIHTLSVFESRIFFGSQFAFKNGLILISFNFFLFFQFINQKNNENGFHRKFYSLEDFRLNSNLKSFIKETCSFQQITIIKKKSEVLP